MAFKTVTWIKPVAKLHLKIQKSLHNTFDEKLRTVWQARRNKRPLLIFPVGTIIFHMVGSGGADDPKFTIYKLEKNGIFGLPKQITIEDHMASIMN